MQLIRFRLDWHRPPAPPTETRLLATALERDLAGAPWAEHGRLHLTRAGVVGVMFYRPSQEHAARRGLQQALSAAVHLSADPAGWRFEH